MSVGRNDPCPCGSGKKYKKCCLEKERAEARYDAEAAVLAAAEARRAQEEQENAEREAQAAAWEKERALTPEEDPPEDDEAKAAAMEDEADLADPDWPALAPQEQRIVDAWLDEVWPVYTGEQCDTRIDWLLGRVVEFLDQHPNLFRYLDLQEEFLFDLGDVTARLGRLGDWIALLKRLATEQPDMYRCCFGYYDLFIITELIRTSERTSIPLYLGRFKEHPGQASDKLETLLDLLSWRGLEAELEELATAPAIRKDGYSAAWLSHLALVPFLEAGDASPEAEARLRAAWSDLHSWRLAELKRDGLARILSLVSRAPAEIGLDLKGPRQLDFLAEVAWSFTGWLRRGGLNWTSARFAADSLESYWTHPARQARGGRFRLDAQELDSYFKMTCRDFTDLHGLGLVSTLQAMAWFVDYLLENRYFSAADARRLHADWVRLYEQTLPDMEATDPARRLCPSYAALLQRPVDPAQPPVRSTETTPPTA